MVTARNLVCWAPLGGTARGMTARMEVHLCELCFFRTLSGLRGELVHTMLNGETEDLSNYALIAR